MTKIEYHNPVLKDESVDGLNIKPEGVYVDVTFGGGGHSRAILEKLGKKGRLFAFDQDADTEPNVPNDKRFLLLQQNFRFLKNNLNYHGFEKVDGVLADLGVSSHQFNEGDRGFSFRFSGKLDMRMNQNGGLTAADVLQKYPQEDLLKIFKEYGEVNNAKKLVQVIMSSRNAGGFDSIEAFTKAIGGLVPKKNENQYLAKVFQALRIEVNNELGVLKSMLQQAAELLDSGGRLSVISYHSLEDRLVKNFFKTGNFEGKVESDLYGNVPTVFKIINRKVIVPGDKEIKENNRARSAKLRIAEKI